MKAYDRDLARGSTHPLPMMIMTKMKQITVDIHKGIIAFRKHISAGSAGARYLARLDSCTLIVGCNRTSWGGRLGSAMRCSNSSAAFFPIA